MDPAGDASRKRDRRCLGECDDFERRCHAAVDAARQEHIARFAKDMHTLDRVLANAKEPFAVPLCFTTCKVFDEMFKNKFIKVGQKVPADPACEQLAELSEVSVRMERTESTCDPLAHAMEWQLNKKVPADPACAQLAELSEVSSHMELTESTCDPLAHATEWTEKRKSANPHGQFSTHDLM